MTNQVIEFLAHYGIKGMQWGVRRKRGSDGRVSSDRKTAQTIARKRLSSMSNEELRKLNTRLELEQKYQSLSAKNISPGKRFVQEVLSNSAKQVATKVITALLDTATKRIMQELVSSQRKSG